MLVILLEEGAGAELTFFEIRHDRELTPSVAPQSRD